MIYPPIKELVDKTGNRYSLVVIAAKRAREIAADEKAIERDKERNQEPSTLESRLKERMEMANPKKYIKPIIRAVYEIANDEIIFGKYIKGQMEQTIIISDDDNTDEVIYDSGDE